MSGFICIFDRDQGILTSDVIATATETMAHRGPDGDGIWTDAQVGLGHQQLQTTPEATYDEQPKRDDKLVIVADARIDNRDELLDTLIITQPANCVPDSRLLLEAYREWGTNCVDHLIGSFSFAVWDAKKESVFCARDHFGVKPLYYHLSDGLFAVASEPKAILSIPTVPTHVDDLMIADFLMHRFEGKTRSYFESVRRLAPAHAMTVSETGEQSWQYWDLDPTETIKLGSDAAYERKFRQLLEQAVQSRLRTTSKIGADLSGGLDSTSVTVTARNLLPDNETLHTFSDVYDDAPSSDEREFIESVADRDGISPNYVFLDDVGMFVDMEDVLQYLDHPPHNTTHFGKWMRAKRINNADITVHLKGEQGDAAVSHGLGYLPELFKRGRWLQLNSELKALGQVAGTSRKQLMVNNVLRQLTPLSAKRSLRRLRGDPILVERANPTLDSSFVRKHGLRKRYKSMEPGVSLFEWSTANKQYADLTSGRNTATFETIDLIDAAFGIEPRYPFADVRLVEFALAIPPSQKLADGYTRSILRRSLGDLLPEKIQWRPWKAMPAEAVDNALRHERDRLRHLIENPDSVTEYLDEQALEAAYKRFIEDDSGLDRRSIYKALSLSVWLKERDTENDP